MTLEKLNDDIFVTEENALSMLRDETLANMGSFADEYELICGKKLTLKEAYMFQMYVDRFYKVDELIG